MATEKKAPKVQVPLAQRITDQMTKGAMNRKLSKEELAKIKDHADKLLAFFA